MQSQEQNKYKLINGPIAKQLIIFALPIVFASLFQQLYNMIDGVIVSVFIGENAMTAVKQSEKVIMVLLSFFMGISAGAGVIVSQYFGSKDFKNLSKVVHNTIVLSIICGAFMSVVGYFLAPQVLLVMNVNPEHIELATTYLRIYFVGTVFAFIFNMGTGILRAVGDSVSPLIFLFVSIIVNAFLDIVFVKYFNMGIGGSAWATVICQAITSVAIILRLKMSKNPYKLSIKKLTLDKGMTSKTARIGVPMGLQNCIISSAHIFMMYFINQFGTNAANGAALYGMMDGFIYLPFNCLALALSVFVGQNVGASKFDRAKKAVGKTILIGEISTVVLGVLVFIFARPIMTLLGTAESIEYGMMFMYVLVFSYPILVINDALAGAIRGAGKAGVVAGILIGGMFLLRIVFILVGMKIYHNVIIVFLSYPVSWTFTTTMLAIYYFKGNWLKRIIEPQGQDLTQSLEQSLTQSQEQSLTQSLEQSLTQSLEQSLTQSIGQTSTQVSIENSIQTTQNLAEEI